MKSYRDKSLKQDENQWYRDTRDTVKIQSYCCYGPTTKASVVSVLFHDLPLKQQQSKIQYTPKKKPDHLPFKERAIANHSQIPKEETGRTTTRILKILLRKILSSTQKSNLLQDIRTSTPVNSEYKPQTTLQKSPQEHKNPHS